VSVLRGFSCLYTWAYNVRLRLGTTSRPITSTAAAAAAAAAAGAAGVVERDGIAGSIITGAVAGRLEIGLARCIDHPRRRRRRGEMHFNNH